MFTHPSGVIHFAKYVCDSQVQPGIFSIQFKGMDVGVERLIELVARGVHVAQHRPGFQAAGMFAREFFQKCQGFVRLFEAHQAVGVAQRRPFVIGEIC